MSAASNPVRIAMIGAGFIAEHYLTALQSIRDHDVVTVMARDQAKGRALADRFGVPDVDPNVAAVAARGDVDLAIVALPHDLHVDVIETLAAAGIGLVCTKPLGRNADEAARCYRAVEQAGVWHGYAESAVYAPGLAEAHRLATSGAIGRVLWVRAREAHGHPHHHARDPERMGGGPLRGLGIHCVAIGRLMFDGAMPTEVFAWGDRLHRDDVEVEDNVLLIARFDDGRIVQVESSWTHVAGLDVRTEIHGSDGWIHTDETGATGVGAFTGGSAGEVVEKAGSDVGWLRPVPDEVHTYGFHAELQHFVRCFRDGSTASQTFRDGVIDNAVVDAGYRAMQQQAWVPVVYPDAVRSDAAG
ncbi:MAG: Gfo/Idh/MocA family oxidoreductase [Ilumatobacter fluminis]|uniref:Gfo/Idh/MocA family protein n=1 Tax=Ilumatobacter fluminis TaxID=467091 RepID=UPI0032EC011A